MKHCECANYLSLDCEKGMCALDKTIVPIDGEGSDACPRFKEGFLCRNCTHFTDADKYGIGNCSGLRKKTGRMPSTALSAASIISSAERKKTRQVKGVTP